MRKLFPLFLIFSLTFNLFGQTGSVLALDRPEKPEKPTPPANPLEEVTVTPTPSAAGGPTETPTPLPKPSKPPKPRITENTEAAIENTEGSAEGVEEVSPQNSEPASGGPTAQNSDNGANSENTSTIKESNETEISQENELNLENNFQVEVETGDNFANYSVGDAEIITGDANVSLTLVNSGNENAVSASNSSLNTHTQNTQNSPNSQNTENGAHSENTAETKTSESTTIESKNQAELKNNFAVSSETGGNNVNYTTGGDAQIQTGNAVTTVNVLNFTNTNGVEVAVKEFNILDDQTGDVTLDFSDAQAIAANSGNGADSTNKTAIDDTGTIVIVNENNAKVENEVVVNTDTGGNNANFTTGGDANIQTGDANVVVNVINFLNNNLTAVGEVVVGVVNIFGNLVGDLILPGSTVNIGNGAGSVNTAQIEAESSKTIIQSNTANIDNTVEIAANTGGNNANYNTGGNTQIATGQTNLNVSATTIANENLVAGSDDSEPIYVVLVNEMGKWVGKILGVENSGNGAGSENSAEVNLNQSTEITQENSAEVKNNITINANTGDNSTSYTTDGNASIETGDVNVLTNIVNFLNNNFVGKKIVLSIINVFGSWVGDLATTDDTEETVENTEEENEEEIEEEEIEELPNPPLTQEASPAKEITPANSLNSQNSPITEDGQSASWRTPTLTGAIVNPVDPGVTPESTSDGQTTPTPTPSSPSLLTEETSTKTETVLDLIADIGNGEINLNQNLFSQSFTKKTIQQKKQNVLAQRPTNTPSPWANRSLLPTITDEIKLAENGRHLPWNLSSAILMALGIIAGILKRFFG